jgi:hypothetical protein
VKSSVNLEDPGFNDFSTTIVQVLKRSLLLSPLQFQFAPLAKAKEVTGMEKYPRVEMGQLIDTRDATEHNDFFA